MSFPTLTFVAGPNGSGKSTLTSANVEFFSQFPLLDPDVLAKTIQADSLHASPLTAGREVLAKVRAYLQRGESFAVETTLSGKNYLQTMLNARQFGFRVGLVYVGTGDVTINISRIADRVIGGGHHVPEVDVRRRYARSLKNLVIAAHRADFSIIFDNSSEAGYQQIALIQAQQIEWFQPIPPWAQPLKASFEAIQK